MDVLEQFLGGGTATSPSKPTPNNPGNLRPVGGATGFQQFATPEEGIAAADKNLQAYGKKGINTLRGVISRWAPPSENDTEAYINTVSKKIGLDPNQPIDLSDPVQRHVISGAMFTVEKGSKNLFKGQQSAQQPTQQVTSSDPLEAFLSGGKAPAPVQTSTAGAGRGSYAGFDTQAAAEAAGKSTRGEPAPGGTAVGRTAAKLLGGALEARRNLGERVVGAIDTAYGVVPMAYGAATQAVVRPFTTPERAEQIGQAATQAIAQPVGKALGITGSEAYQKPLGGITEPVIEQVRNMAEKLGLTAQQISEKTGIPEQDIKNMAVIASFALPQAFKEVAPVAKQGVQAVAAPIERNVIQPLREAAAELEVVKPGQLTKAQAEAQFAAMQGKPALGSAGAAKVEFNPYAGQITGEEGARGQFPQIKLSKTRENVPVTEQATRSQIANEILGDSGQVRPGVVTGNEDILRNEYTKAKMANPTPEGELLKKQIADEQVALSNYAQKRVENSGASPTLVTPYERGERINSAFAGDDGLAGFFKSEKNNLYKEATNRTGNNPIATSNVENLFADKQFRAGLGLKGNEGVAKAAEQLIELAKTVGFKDEMGNVYAPNTVGAWTAVQKSLNSNWTRENAAVIRQINQAIERDIAGAGGLDLLKKADQLHQAEKVLFGSKGIKQVFGDIDPNGVQTATAFDAIPQKLNSMPTDQWRHIYETAEKVAKGTIDGPIDKATGLPKWSIQVPEELRISAQSAANEMRGNLAREIYQAGAAKAGEWNQNAVNKILNARADKIKMAFSPEEQAAFHKLNIGGYLMPGTHAYEGAGQQVRRIGIIESNLEKAGATTGAAIGTAIAPGVGTAVGTYLGQKAGARAAAGIGERALVKAAQKSQKEMQKAAQLGKQTGSNKLSDLGGK